MLWTHTSNILADNMHFFKYFCDFFAFWKRFYILTVQNMDQPEENDPGEDGYREGDERRPGEIGETGSGRSGGQDMHK